MRICPGSGMIYSMYIVPGIRGDDGWCDSLFVQRHDLVRSIQKEGRFLYACSGGLA